jgi:peptide deformylase
MTDVIKENDVIRINTDPYKNEPSVLQEKIRIFDLVPEAHPALKKVLPDFDFKKPPVDPNFFASSLVETCKLHNGLGLSANQCGFEYRVFVMGSADNYVAFFNPKILKSSEQQSKMEEGCLSYKGLFLNVERPAEIEVEYQDFNGILRQAKFTGMTARCFQHELDHMNGITYHSHVGTVSIQLAQKRRSKYLKLLSKTLKETNNGNNRSGNYRNIR